MNKAIKELYQKAYADYIEAAISEDELEESRAKKDFDEKVKKLTGKASSEETKTALTELSEIHIEYVSLVQQNAFVSGFKKGAQLMKDIIA